MRRVRLILVLLIGLIGATVVSYAATDSLHLFNGFESLFYYSIRIEDDYPNLEPVTAATREFEQAIRNDVDVDEARLMLGMVHQASDEPEEALEYYQQVVGRRGQDAWIQVLIGDVHQELGDREAAEQAYQQALKWEDYAKAHYGMGQILLQQQRYPEAIAAFQSALEQAPEFWLAHLELGRAYYYNNQLTEAETSLEEVERFTSRVSKTYEYLGAVYRELEKHEQADHALERAEELREMPQE